MANGMGCKCAARSAGECGCVGVDWTPQELIDARATIEELKGIILDNLDLYDNCPCAWCKHHTHAAEEHCGAPDEKTMQDDRCPFYFPT